MGGAPSSQMQMPVGISDSSSTGGSRVAWSSVRRQICVGEFQQYLTRKYGTIEGSWLVAFKNHDKSGQINYTRFCQGCKAAGYVGNVAKLWAMLDEDRSGEISLQE